jgi:thymidylate synthase (FAD)
MKVTLISYTQDAKEVMIFTKQARLSALPGKFEEIKGWSEEKKLIELEYMANTIPSSWEFSDYIFSIEGVTRAFTHQFVRTRTGSYAQQSMRVTDMEGFDYHYGESVLEYPHGERIVSDIIDRIASAYQKLINSGVRIEDARGILPTNIKTNIVAKFNLRTLAEMCRSRTGGRTQGEYRDVMQLMADEVLAVHPWAALFLFPKERGYFDGIEELIKSISDPVLKQNMLKAIDVMRKRND